MGFSPFSLFFWTHNFYFVWSPLQRQMRQPGVQYWSILIPNIASSTLWDYFPEFISVQSPSSSNSNISCFSFIKFYIMRRVVVRLPGHFHMHFWAICLIVTCFLSLLVSWNRRNVQRQLAGQVDVEGEWGGSRHHGAFPWRYSNHGQGM